MIDNPYSHYENDKRDQQTIQKQSEIVNKICDRNSLAFKNFIRNKLIQQNEQLQKQQQQKKEKVKLKIERLDFGEGRYIEYRDNKDNELTFQKLNKTIILISGVPGGIRYYNRIEMSIDSNFCRMINLYIPGFDKKDEQRGSYKGSLDDLVQIIHDFMEKLNIPKAAFLFHSFGGLIVKNFAYFHPQKVEAMILIASVPITKWRGFKIYEKIESSFYEIDMNDPLTELFSENYKQKIYTRLQQVQEDLKQLTPEQIEKLGVFFKFGYYDVVNLMKLRASVPGGLLEAIHRMNKVSKLIPRMMVYSSKDNLIEAKLFEEEIYEFIVGENAVKRKILQQIHPEPELDKNNFCGNYIFRYDDATHSVFHEKGKEIGFLVQHFVSQLDDTEIIHKYPKL